MYLERMHDSSDRTALCIRTDMLLQPAAAAAVADVMRCCKLSTKLDVN